MRVVQGLRDEGPYMWREDVHGGGSIRAGGGAGGGGAGGDGAGGSDACGRGGAMGREGGVVSGAGLALGGTRGAVWRYDGASAWGCGGSGETTAWESSAWEGAAMEDRVLVASGDVDAEDGAAARIAADIDALFGEEDVAGRGGEWDGVAQYQAHFGVKEGGATYGAFAGSGGYVRGA